METNFNELHSQEQNRTKSEIILDMTLGSFCSRIEWLLLNHVMEIDTDDPSGKIILPTQENNMHNLGSEEGFSKLATFRNWINKNVEFVDEKMNMRLSLILKTYKSNYSDIPAKMQFVVFVNTLLKDQGLTRLICQSLAERRTQ